MSRCDEHHVDILLYVDNALIGQKLEDFRAHLANCSDCQRCLEEERALSSLLRETRPLYLAPQALRTRIAAIAAQQAPVSSPTPDHSRKTRVQNLKQWSRDVIRHAFSWKPLAATILVVVLGLVFIPDAVQRVRATDYVEAATRIHRSYLGGVLPLQCRSRSPEVITAWFAGETPFHFQLPAPQSVPNSKPVYWLTGARLVS
jgi:anti-sigma factor RsiW